MPQDPEASGKARRLTGEERKKAIAEATLQIVAAHGVQGATTVRIAASQGISEKALYKQFATRKEILLAALETVFERAVRHLDVQKGDNALETLRAVAQAHWPSQQEFVYPLFEFMVSSPQEDLRKEFTARHQLDLEFIGGLIEEGKTQGVIRRDVDPELAAWEFWAVIWADNLAYMLGFDDFGARGLSSRMIEDFLQNISLAPAGEER